MTWFLIAALVGFTSAGIVEKPDGIHAQRMSSWDSAALHIYGRAIDRDSSEDGVSPGSKQPNCPCGWANRYEVGANFSDHLMYFPCKSGGSRIVGGTYYKENEYPFIAAIVRIVKDGIKPFCGGSIITPNHVITAAHCTDLIIKERAPIAVLLGTHDLSKQSPNAVALGVEAIFQHENFDPITALNDLCILVLSNSINYNAIIGPVCMPQPGLDVTGQRVRIMGWGAEQFNGVGTSSAKKIDSTVVTPAVCSAAWGGGISARKPTQICTHSSHESACQGDSGGPVVSLDPQTNRYTLVGVVSFGPGCKVNKPSVHTKVEAYLPWIQRVISTTKPSETCVKV